MPTPTITPALTRPGGPPGRSGPPADSGGGDFAALLDQTTARTAPAEGQQTKGRAGEARAHGAGKPQLGGVAAAPAESDAAPQVDPATPASGDATSATPGDAAAGDEATPLVVWAPVTGPTAPPAAIQDAALAEAAAALAAPAAQLPAPPASPDGQSRTTGTASTIDGERPSRHAHGHLALAVADTAAPQGAAGAASNAEPILADGALSAAAPASIGDASAPAADGAPSAKPAPDTTLAADAAGRIDRHMSGTSAPAPTATGAPADPTRVADPATNADPSALAPRNRPATAPHRHGEHGAHDAGAARGQGDARSAMSTTSATPAAGGDPAVTATLAPTAGAAAPATDTATPAVAPAPSPATGAGIAPHAPTTASASPTPYAPPLAHASLHTTVERVHELVRIATLRGGQARATLHLKPVELGMVDVQLRTTREGLVATISARDEAGLQALQQAGGELRRSLEDRGVTLHRLDLQLTQSPAGGSAGDGGFGGAWTGERSSSRTRGGSSTAQPADDPSDDELVVATVTTRTPAGALVDVQA